jgi:hypothetical protein
MVIVASNYIPESVQSAYGDLDARVILETFGVDVFTPPPGGPCVTQFTYTASTRRFARACFSVPTGGSLRPMSSHITFFHRIG